MVSASASWPVRMMIGALKPVLRRTFTASRPSMSGSPTSMDHEIDQPGPGGVDALGRVGFLQNGELLVQRELLGEGLAEVVVIVDQKDAACAHTVPSLIAVRAARPTGL